MKHVTEDRQTNLRIKIYLLTTIMMDAVLELPTLWNFDQWHYEDVIAVIKRSQLALEEADTCVDELGVLDGLDESTQAAIEFAQTVCSECRSTIDFVRTELTLYVN